jgi:hypothetical protein
VKYIKGTTIERKERKKQTNNQKINNTISFDDIT